MVHKSNIYYSESISKRNLKEYTSSSVTEKNATFQAPSSILSIWRDGLDILDIDTQLNSLKLKWIQRLLMLLSCQCSLKKISCCMFRLNLILNSNQGLALSRQKRILSSNRHRSKTDCENRSMKIPGYTSPITTSLPTHL